MHPAVIEGWLGDIESASIAQYTGNPQGDCDGGDGACRDEIAKAATSGAQTLVSQEASRKRKRSEDPEPASMERRQSPRKASRKSPGKRQDATASRGRSDADNEVAEGSLPSAAQPTPRPSGMAAALASITLTPSTILSPPSVSPSVPSSAPSSVAGASSIGQSASPSRASTVASQASGNTPRARSTSPVKRSADLAKLQKPVAWVSSPNGLRDAAKDHSPKTFELYEDILRLTRGRGYLPPELRHLLVDELELLPDDETSFGPKRSVADIVGAASAAALQAEHEKFLVGSERVGEDGTAEWGPPPQDAQDHLLVRQLLWEELRDLRHVVAATLDCKSRTRSEAAWNDGVHAPVLRLALRPLADTGIVAENMTRATISNRFVPVAAPDIAQQLGSKMIDYAFALCDSQAEVAASDDQDDSAVDHGKSFAFRMASFLDRLSDKRLFNQTSYAPVERAPTGVFIETKVSSDRHDEAKAQLGMWLASWFNRVSAFKRPPPVVPVLLVVGERWEMWFAFDRGKTIRIHGPLSVGETGELDSLFRLVMVLRRLGKWMVGPFQEWVEDVISVGQVAV